MDRFYARGIVHRVPAFRLLQTLPDESLHRLHFPAGVGGAFRIRDIRPETGRWAALARSNDRICWRTARGDGVRRFPAAVRVCEGMGHRLDRAPNEPL